MPLSRFGARTRTVLHELRLLDAAMYGAIARVETPTLDLRFGQLSRAADHARLWLGVAALLAVLDQRRGVAAARSGLVSLAAASVTVNIGMKRLLGGRRRPDRVLARVPEARHVPMPSSPSFPSGHAASAFAFATAAGHALPVAALPLRALAAAVAYSRVHTGVHYPLDVVAGALVGKAIGGSVTILETLRRCSAASA